MSSQNGSGDHQTIANAASWTVWGSKMDSKGAPRAPTQRLGVVWSAKWAPNELRERRKIVKKVNVFKCKLAFSPLQGFLWLRSGILSRFDLPKRLWPPLRDAEAASWSGLGVQNGPQMSVQSEEKSCKKRVFYSQIAFFVSPGT